MWQGGCKRAKGGRWARCYEACMRLRVLALMSNRVRKSVSRFSNTPDFLWCVLPEYVASQSFESRLCCPDG